jgi:hypothetical protein
MIHNREETSPQKKIEKIKNNIFFMYSYNNNNNNYTIYINKYIAISFATISTISLAHLIKYFIY